MKYVHPFLCMLAFIPAGAAWGHSDALVVDVGGQVAVGSAEGIGGSRESFDLETRVFESILRGGFSHPVLAADYEAVEPGFFGLDTVSDAGALATLGAAALPAGADLSLALSTFTIDGDGASLFYWDGTGLVDFDPAPGGTTFAFQPAASFGTTGPHGEVDVHPLYRLDIIGGGVPADGVYLIAPALDVTGLATSERFFVVLLVDHLIDTEDDLEELEAALEALEAGESDTAFLHGKDFAFFEEAVEHVELNIAVPEPSAGALVLAALGLVASLRKR